MSGLEVLGAVASAVQLATLSHQLITSISTLCTQLKDTPINLKQRISQIESLIEVTKLIECSPQLQTVEIASVVRRCIVDAEALIEVLKGLRVRQRDGLVGRYWKAVGGLKKEGKILAVFGSLEREKSALVLCITRIDS